MDYPLLRKSYFCDGHLCQQYTFRSYKCTVSLPWSVSGKFSEADIKTTWEKREPKMTDWVKLALFEMRRLLLRNARSLQREAKRCLA